jgi:small subunit ribosomal protein S3
MGRKVHPYGFRVGVTKHWQARWFSERDYAGLVHEDLRMRRIVLDRLPDAGISEITIDRNANQLTLTVQTAKPGIVIGRGGANVEQLRAALERSTERRVRLNIEEIRVRRWTRSWSRARSPTSSSDGSRSGGR